VPDWLNDMWTSILDIWLPSKWPRLVVTTAMGLEIGILTLSTWGPKFGLTPTGSQMSIIRTVGSPWLFFFSLALIHYLVVRDKNSSYNLQPWKFQEKITLSIGSYHDVMTKHGDKFFRITLKDISQKEMPPQYESPDSTPDEIKTDVATIGCTSHFLYQGSRVKKILEYGFSNEESFHIPKHDYQEESDSIFFFKTEHVNDGEFFFRCFVDHINHVKKEVELDIFFIWLHPEKHKIYGMENQ